MALGKNRGAILPKSFVDRRLHSLAGVWIVIFLIEHLLTNSQAALLLGHNGSGFVRMVNFLHDLPYLEVIEIVLLAIPILAHGIWGIQYLLKAKSNFLPSSGKEPSLVQYRRNHAYSWQRYTAWILLVGIVLHVIQMRFIDYPLILRQGINNDYYMVRLSVDPGLYTVAKRLDTTLYDNARINQEMYNLQKFLKMQEKHLPPPVINDSPDFNPLLQKFLDAQQTKEQYIDYVQALKKKNLRDDQVIAVSGKIGTAILLTVRDTFKSPLMITLYTLFVLSACFHAFNGLWTACIAWGILLTKRSQVVMGRIVICLIVLLAFLGLAAIWGTYWVNLRY